MKQTPAIKQSKRLARFDEKFSLLTNFLKKEKRFPGKTEDPKLYSWMSGLMHEKKKDRLEPEFVERLDSIGFIWSRRDFNKLQKGGSSEQDNSTPKLEARWAKRLEELKEYRQRNPVKWPIVESADPFEKKLGIWCMTLRNRFRQGNLDEKWINELKGIGFNLEGRLDNWKLRFEKLKQYLELNKKLPEPKHELYAWARLQHVNFDELSLGRQKLLKSIKFQQYYEEKGWAVWLGKLKQYIIRNGKTPTIKTDKALYHWLTNQRKKYREGRLNENEVFSLMELGVDLAPNRNSE